MFFPSSNSGTLIGTILRCNILDIHQVYCQREFQDPKMEVLYHIRPYFVGIFPYLHRPYIGLIYCRHLEIRFLKWPIYTVYPTGSIKLEKYPYIYPRNIMDALREKNTMYIYICILKTYSTISLYHTISKQQKTSPSHKSPKETGYLTKSFWNIYIYIY